MAGLADWLEDYRNWRGRQEWEQGKGWQDFFNGDPRAQEQFEKLSGFGTDAGGLVGMIKASHGSPHAFDKFDFTKIGTGEGAQAYGHGGYFAQGFDSPVAKEYRDALAGVEVGGKVMTPEWDSPYYYPLQALRKHGDDIEKARADVYERNKNIPGGWPEELVAFEDAVKQGIKRNQGHLYNVELRWPDAAREAADPLGQHHLLDWYAPFSQQPEGVKAILEPIIPRGEVNPHGLDMGGGTILDNRTRQADPNQPHPWVLKAGDSMFGLSQSDVDRMVGEMNDPTGENIYTRLVGEKGGQAQASKYLRSLGLPGIKYWDEGSRGAGQGTRNYVMFDDALANIVSRNGVSLSDLLRR